jgi:hypothetical protein
VRWIFPFPTHFPSRDSRTSLMPVPASQHEMNVCQRNPIWLQETSCIIAVGCPARELGCAGRHSFHAGWRARASEYSVIRGVQNNLTIPSRSPWTMPDDPRSQPESFPSLHVNWVALADIHFMLAGGHGHQRGSTISRWEMRCLTIQEANPNLSLPNSFPIER